MSNSIYKEIIRNEIICLIHDNTVGNLLLPLESEIYRLPYEQPNNQHLLLFC